MEIRDIFKWYMPDTLVVRARYMMWEELSVKPFLKHPTLKMFQSRALWLLFSIKSSDYGTTIA